MSVSENRASHTMFACPAVSDETTVLSTLVFIIIIKDFVRYSIQLNISCEIECVCWLQGHGEMKSSLEEKSS